MTDISHPKIKKYLSARIIRDGDCEVWTGPVEAGQHPLLCIRRNSFTVRSLVRRLVFFGHTDAARCKILTVSCGNPLCVRLEHIVEYHPSKRAEQPRKVIPGVRPEWTSKLTDAQVSRAIEMYGDGVSQAAIARALKVSASTISRALRRGI